MSRCPTFLMLLPLSALVACGDSANKSSAGSPAGDTAEAGDTADEADSGDTSDSGEPDTPVDADGDGLDDTEDCDDNDDTVGLPALWYADADGDGYGDPARSTEACEAPADHVDNADDCDDSSAMALPGGLETCDALDNDCNGVVDDGDSFTPVPATSPDALQSAIDSAEAGDLLCVGPGTHGAISLTSQIVHLVGAAGSEATILDAEGSSRTINSQGSQLVVEGLTLRGGTTGDGFRGAALWVHGGVFTATDLVIDDVQQQDTAVQGVVAVSSTPGFTADGLVLRDLDIDVNADIEGIIHFSSAGGTLRNVTIQDNHIAGNSVYGGVLALSSTVTVEDLDVLSNTYEGSRTACYAFIAEGGSRTSTLTRARVIDNATLGSSASGGAVCARHYGGVVVRNLLVAGTESGEWSGSGPLVASSSGATLDAAHITVVGLDTVYGGLLHSWTNADSQISVRNAVVVDTHTGLGALSYLSASDGADVELAWVTHSGLTSDDGELHAGTPGGDWTTTDIHAGTVVFEDTSAASMLDWDFRLAAGSAGIDAGDPSLTDPDGSACDLGAFGGPDAW